VMHRAPPCSFLSDGRDGRRRLSCSEVPMRRLLIAGLLAVSLSLGFGAAATAAPIACSQSQTAVHTSADGWYCENPAGHGNESAKPKH
jgi:hypothetical protein